MAAVIYIVLFARTKVAMKANKMLLIIQPRGRATEGPSFNIIRHKCFLVLRKWSVFVFFLLLFLSDSSHFPGNLLHNVCFESAVEIYRSDQK